MAGAERAGPRHAGCGRSGSVKTDPTPPAAPTPSARSASRHRLPRGLRARLVAVYGLTVVSTSLALALLLFVQMRATLRDEFEKRGAALAQVLAANTRQALSSDPSLLAGQVASLLENEDVRYAIVQDCEGQVVAQAGQAGLDLREIRSQIVSKVWTSSPATHGVVRLDCGDRFTNFTASVRGSATGSELVRVGLSAKRTNAQILWALGRSLGLGLLLSGLGLFGMLLLTRWMLRPLRRMADVARAIAAGDLSQRVAADASDEIGALADAFSEMSESLAASQSELGRRNSDLERAAAEKERLYRNVEMRARRAEARNELAKAMASSLDATEICGQVHAELSRVLAYDALTVVRFDPEKAAYSRAYFAPELSGSVAEALEYADDDWTALHAVRAAHRSLHLGAEGRAGAPDGVHGAVSSRLRGAGLEHAFLIPIVAGGDFLGVLSLAWREHPGLSTEDEQMLLATADNLGLVLRNATLYQKLDRSFTDLRETQERLAHSEEARRMDRLRTVGQMASGIAHNFNNVMSAIIGRVQLLKIKILRGDADQEAIEKSLDVIERAGLDGAETVRRLQEFSRGESSQTPVQSDLNELVQGVLEITRPRWKDEAERAGVHIRAATELERLPAVSCVPSEIREVLTNLIFNAVDAMPKGGDLRIATRAEAGAARLIVSDTGTGMPPLVRERLFEPFFTTKGVRGTGLGLSTVYGIIRRHGGEIAVQSVEQGGTRFEITLPLARPNAPHGREEGMMGSRPWRILVGDDEANVREVLVELLRLLGHEVVQASGGVETVALFQPGAFDLVFTDLGMPDKSGWEVAEEIRARDPEVAVVLATGWGSQISAEEASRRGVTRVLAKPFTVQKISSLIAELQGAREAA